MLIMRLLLLAKAWLMGDAETNSQGVPLFLPVFMSNEQSERNLLPAKSQVL